MRKIVTVIMGQNCERFIEMALESVKESDEIIYCDGGSEDHSVSIAARNMAKIISNRYHQDIKEMNGRQRNFYLDYVKDNYPEWWCLCIDADEVVEDFSSLKRWVNQASDGVYSVKMRHFIGDLGHEDATVPRHFVPNRLFKVSCASGYPECEHPVLGLIAEKGILGATDCTTIWHLAYVPNLWEIKKRYDNHMKKSEMHTPGFLKKWYVQHLFGQYPRTPIFPLEVPSLIMKKFGIEYDEIYFNYHSTLEAKHFIMMKQWADYFYQKHPEAKGGYNPKVLDIGCGIGLYGIAARTLGMDWLGIEKSEWAVKHATVPINQGDITNLTVLSEHDLVLCIDILEHLNESDLDKSLQNIKGTGEIFIFSIPFRGDPNLDQDPTHKIKQSKEWWMNKVGQYFKVKEAPKEWMFSNQILIGESQ